MERSHPLWQKLLNAAGRDLRDVYKTMNSVRDSREYLLPPQVKLPAIVETSKAVRAKQMTFGAADNEFQYLSDSNCCCSGVDQFPGFENWFKHQIGYAIRKSLGNRITYDSISREWLPDGSIDRFLNPHSRLSTRFGVAGSVRDHILARWNNPRASGSPASYYGVIATSETTANGNRVYSWDRQVLRLLGIKSRVDANGA
ncbi:MAG TPA: hypothetical protein VJS64_15760 [Pyrinomonadaceae bacterium]|nr:hypothetical protein [Pyrinomonadaceae bacterium]